MANEKQNRAMKAEPVVMSGIEDIRAKIYCVRGVQVMLAPDLADVYQVSTSVFNQAVKRNIRRFPEGFRFQLTKEELQEVITNCDNPDRLRFSPKTPFAFTEQGIGMLSGVLSSDMAVQTSIRIMNTFVAMRKTLVSMSQLMGRIEANERRQIADQAKNDANQILNEERFQKVFKALDEQKEKVQGVFYDGQLWDACSLVERLIARAKKSVLLIDSWVDAGTLDMLAKKRKGVKVEAVTSPRGNALAESDIAKFNAQYGGLAVRTSKSFHDRFLIVDDKELYLIGASLKDLGKKCFAFTKLDASAIAGLKERV